jgi:acetoacetyl-CoA reductase
MFSGRVALVTGGTRGIGAAITEEMAAAGLHVAAGYHRNFDAAKALQDELVAKGYSVSLHQGNVGVPEDCTRVANELLRDHGRIDYLINNAGITIDKTVRNMTIEDWHAVLRVNLSGTFYMTKAVIEHMLERGSGRIVNISSFVGEAGNFGQANYAASKAGQIGFTKSLALELARKGITVNSISPGFISTDMLSEIPQKLIDGIIEKIPVRRLGEPSEVARVARFLCEDESGYITGAMIPVNGGIEMS